MTRKKRHHGQAYVEPIVHWIVYRPGKAEKKHSYNAVYLEAFSERTSTWGIDKGRAIRFTSRAAAEEAFESTTAGWEDRDLVDSCQIVPSDTVTT
jgi:hypothetical protein